MEEMTPLLKAVDTLERWLFLEKARPTKYIRRAPDGKGGWKYFYKEDVKKQDSKEIPEEKDIKKNDIPEKRIAIQFEEGDNTYLIHRSTKVGTPPIQMSKFDENMEPFGHAEYDSLHDALMQNRRAIDHPVFNMMRNNSNDKMLDVFFSALDKLKSIFPENTSDFKYKYIQPYRPVSSDPRAGKFGIGVDVDNVGVIFTKSPIPLSEQKKLEIFPYLDKARSEAIKDYIKEKGFE